MRQIIGFLVAVFMGVGVQASEFPSESIYQFKASWQNAQGQSVSFESLAGKKQIVAMFYSHCLTACPVIVSEMQKIEKALSAKQKKNTGFVLVSMDSENETAKSLAAFAKKRGLGENWQLLHGSKENVRALAMLLNVRYQRTDDGEIAHSKLIHLLDSKGRLLQQTTQVKDAKALVKEWGL